MNLPKTGRVVVIDDDHQEAIPLIKALSQNGVPSLFFTGNIESLPTTPLNSVRIIFLDVELGTEGQSIKTKLSTIKSILARIINKENGPYIIIAWTKFKNLVPQIKKVLKDNPPYLVLAIAKSDCLDSTTGEFDLNIIASKIKPEIEKIGMFQIFNLWEELITQSSHQVINDISNFYKTNKDWHKNVSRVFYKLAHAYSGKTLIGTDISAIINNSLLAFNPVFTDTIERSIGTKTWPADITSIEKIGDIDIKTLAKINTKLHLIHKPTSSPIKPGSIFRIKPSAKQKKTMIEEFKKFSEDDVWKNLFAESKSKNLTEIFNNQGKIEDVTLKAEFKTFKQILNKKILNETSIIQIEISPECDFIQSKQRTNRFITGILWPYKYSKFLRTKADYMYRSPIFLVRTMPCYFIFDLRYVSSKPLSTLSRSAIICGVRKEILIEIQSYLSRHISRPGVLFLDHNN